MATTSTMASLVLAEPETQRKVAAFKLGMLGSVEIIAAIAEIVADYPDIPLILDPVLAAYVEADKTAPELIAAGHDPELVARVARLVDIAEYKRRQMPPGVKITTKAFGKDRRMPITNRYRP